MTKFKGADSEPLFTLMRTGMYSLKGEKSELADRAHLRQVGTGSTTQSERGQVSGETSFFCSHAIGLTGSLSRVHVGGAM